MMDDIAGQSTDVEDKTSHIEDRDSQNEDPVEIKKTPDVEELAEFETWHVDLHKDSVIYKPGDSSKSQYKPSDAEITNKSSVVSDAVSKDNIQLEHHSTDSESEIRNVTPTPSEDGEFIIDDGDDDDDDDQSLDCSEEITKNSKSCCVPRKEKNVTKKQKIQRAFNLNTWTLEDDLLLKKVAEEVNRKCGKFCWPKVLALTKLNRTKKQLRERYTSHLAPGINKGPWTEEEENILESAWKLFGNAWSRISRLLPGRTANTIKNHFNVTKARKNKKIKPRVCKEVKQRKNEAKTLSSRRQKSNLKNPITKRNKSYANKQDKSKPTILNAWTLEEGTWKELVDVSENSSQHMNPQEANLQQVEDEAEIEVEIKEERLEDPIKADNQQNYSDENFQQQLETQLIIPDQTCPQTTELSTKACEQAPSQEQFIIPDKVWSDNEQDIEEDALSLSNINALKKTKQAPCFHKEASPSLNVAINSSKEKQQVLYISKEPPPLTTLSNVKNTNTKSQENSSNSTEIKNKKSHQKPKKIYRQLAPKPVQPLQQSHIVKNSKSNPSILDVPATCVSNLVYIPPKKIVAQYARIIPTPLAHEINKPRTPLRKPALLQVIEPKSKATTKTQFSNNFEMQSTKNPVYHNNKLQNCCNEAENSRGIVENPKGPNETVCETEIEAKKLKKVNDPLFNIISLFPQKDIIRGYIGVTHSSEQSLYIETNIGNPVLPSASSQRTEVAEENVELGQTTHCINKRVYNDISDKDLHKKEMNNLTIAEESLHAMVNTSNEMSTQERNKKMDNNTKYLDELSRCNTECVVVNNNPEQLLPKSNVIVKKVSVPENHINKYCQLSPKSNMVQKVIIPKTRTDNPASKTDIVEKVSAPENLINVINRKEVKKNEDTLHQLVTDNKLCKDNDPQLLPQCFVRLDRSEVTRYLASKFRDVHTADVTNDYDAAPTQECTEDLVVPHEESPLTKHHKISKTSSSNSDAVKNNKRTKKSLKRGRKANSEVIDLEQGRELDVIESKQGIESSVVRSKRGRKPKVIDSEQERRELIVNSEVERELNANDSNIDENLDINCLDNHCIVCNVKYSSYKQLVLHSKKHLPFHLVSFVCEYCSACCSDSVSLQLHISVKHKEINKTNTENLKCYKCRMCTQIYSNIHIFYIHAFINNKCKLINYECFICKEAFESSKLFTKHCMEIHNTSKTISVMCRICNEENITEALNHQHVITRHANAMVYCKECSMETSLDFYFNHHYKNCIYSQVNDKCIICNEIIDSNSILRHMQRHILNLDSYFYCNICCNFVLSQDNMVMHMTRHNLIRPNNVNPVQ